MKLFIVTLTAASFFLVNCKNEIKADTQLQNSSTSKIRIKTESKTEEVIYPLQIKPLGFDRNVSYFGKKKTNC